MRTRYLTGQPTSGVLSQSSEVPRDEDFGAFRVSKSQHKMGILPPEITRKRLDKHSAVLASHQPSIGSQGLATVDKRKILGKLKNI